ncbi:hypothetical protein HMPREF0497_1077 [Lentilactobacillus buchneri ATCC 11577]|nr:hypothetical protein HMPREF0497_1077 [Lentilactobacillus buchneri ATCC 11577]
MVVVVRGGQMFAKKRPNFPVAFMNARSYNEYLSGGGFCKWIK